jgi:hypothetical protein
MRKKTYVAIAIRESISDSPEYTTLYEETTLLIKAVSVEDATAKAVKYFRDEHTYISAAGFRITTRTLKIEDVNEVLGIVDGDVEEINARFFRDYDAYNKFREMLDKT